MKRWCSTFYTITVSTVESELNMDMVNLFTQQQQNYTFIEIFNADVLIREDITVDQFIDVVLGNRKYLTCIYVSGDLHKVGQTYVEE